jgi:hypothetical protein
MRNLKYIKLFEAFDARTLNVTLKHIKGKEDKKTFLSNLKTVCQKFDIPESKLSDDLFTYLPFNKALRFNNVVSDDQPCDAVGEFVHGERCDHGKVRRPWGRGFRVVDCGTCKGTGIKPKRSDLSLLKFWFNAEGKYIATTAVDGIYRASTNTAATTFSPNITDYDVVKRIPKTQIKNQLETGDIISVDFVDNHWNGTAYNVETQIVAYVYKEVRYGNEIKVFAIQNRRGRYPRPWNNDWRTIGSDSWTLTTSKCNNINLLKAKTNAGGQDPYGYNTLFDMSNFRVRPVQVASTLKDANFAIILDFSKLDKLAVVKKTEVKSGRTESRAGATALISNDDIKNANIKRYFDKIAISFKLTGELHDVSKFTNMAARLFGGRHSMYLLNSSASNNEIDSLSIIAGYIFKMIKKIKTAEKTDIQSAEEGLVGTAVEDLKTNSDFIDIVKSINERYKSSLDNSLKKVDYTTKFIRQIKEKIKADSTEEWVDKDLRILSNIDNLSTEITKYISSIKVDTLEDVEFLIQEIYSIKSLLRSDRMGISNLNGFFDRMRPGSYYNDVRYLYPALTERRQYYGNINNGIQSITTIIRKKLAMLD